MSRLLLGVSGGIAAYKALEFVRLAVRAGHSVRVIQTESSERFVGRTSFAALTGAPVLVGEFEADPARGAYPGEAVPEHAPISHLALVERAELFLIAPASANTIAKLAHGHADNLLSTAALAAACPLAVAPAMNDRMYLHAATRDNLRRLAARGVTVVPPGEGELASRGEYGIGRLPEAAELLEVCRSLLTPPSWTGTRVLVTAGGTREPIDRVRYVGNRSSGRMGMALAAAAQRRGAEVTVVAANVSIPRPRAIAAIEVTTAADLGQACREAFDETDVLLMAAAVADFRPVAPAAGKLKKADGVPALELEPTEDVLSALAARRRPGQVLVGFAAEDGAGGLAYARGKLEAKRLDLVVLNDISRPDIGFDAAENEVILLRAGGGTRHLGRTSKDEVAEAILDEVERLRRERGEDAAAPAGPRSPAGV